VDLTLTGRPDFRCVAMIRHRDGDVIGLETREALPVDGNRSGSLREGARDWPSRSRDERGYHEARDGGRSDPSSPRRTERL
jgi:hypothetical protein